MLTCTSQCLAIVAHESYAVVGQDSERLSRSINHQTLTLTLAPALSLTLTPTLNLSLALAHSLTLTITLA